MPFPDPFPDFNDLVAANSRWVNGAHEDNGRILNDDEFLNIDRLWDTGRRGTSPANDTLLSIGTPTTLTHRANHRPHPLAAPRALSLRTPPSRIANDRPLTESQMNPPARPPRDLNLSTPLSARISSPRATHRRTGLHTAPSALSPPATPSRIITNDRPRMESQMNSPARPSRNMSPLSSARISSVNTRPSNPGMTSRPPAPIRPPPTPQSSSTQNNRVGNDLFSGGHPLVASREREPNRNAAWQETFDNAVMNGDAFLAAEVMDQMVNDDLRAALPASGFWELPSMPADERQVLFLDPMFSNSDFARQMFDEGPLPRFDREVPSHPAASHDRDAQEFESDQITVDRGLRPRYLRYNYWGETETLPVTLADWSKTAKPLPDPPLAELNNPVVLETLARFPSLFKIVTPIKVDVFESLLATHPNRSFVASVCKGLRDGFWPFADTRPGEYPRISDVRGRKTDDPREVQFLREQRDIEISKGRFSESFGTTLYGGMYNSPTYAIPKPGSSDFRLVTDQSRGEYSLNSMIDPADVAGMPMDDMRHFGERLLSVHGRSSNRLLVLWKSDVAEAYRICPVHPHWQIKQVVTIDGQRHIDRNNSFGGRASFNIWGSVNSLVMWIAEHVCGINRALCFNDDVFGVCDANDIEFYQPYNRHMPRDQCTLLRLWDQLGIPHKEKKQKSGNPLTIIGIEVDANKMTMTLPGDVQAKLVDKLLSYTTLPLRSFSRQEFEQLIGWINWAFNVFPLLRPCLSNITNSLSKSDASMMCTMDMRNDLLWALQHITSMEGVRILESRAWGPEEAHITLYTDACLEGMGFWYPKTKEAFYCDTPSEDKLQRIPNLPSNPIFYFEALCVTSAFLDAASRLTSPSKIVIYTDNSNTVAIFDTLRARPSYNPLLKEVADVMIARRHRLKVLHVPGEENTIADHISRKRFGEARGIEPTISIKDFTPLRHLAGR